MVVFGEKSDFHKISPNSFFSLFAKSVMIFSSFPHIVMRISGSVPEGRTRRRPETDLSFWSKSSNRFLAFLEVLRFSFWMGVVSILIMTCGNLVMIDERSLRDFLVSEIILVIMSAVSIPSPVA